MFSRLLPGPSVWPRIISACRRPSHHPFASVGSVVTFLSAPRRPIRDRPAAPKQSADPSTADHPARTGPITRIGRHAVRTLSPTIHRPVRSSASHEVSSPSALTGGVALFRGNRPRNDPASTFSPPKPARRTVAAIAHAVFRFGGFDAMMLEVADLRERCLVRIHAVQGRRLKMEPAAPVVV